MADKNAAEMLQYWPSQNYFANKCLKIQNAIQVSDGHNKMVNVNNKSFPLVILK